MHTCLWDNLGALIKRNSQHYRCSELTHRLAIQVRNIPRMEYISFNESILLLKQAYDNEAVTFIGGLTLNQADGA